MKDAPSAAAAEITPAELNHLLAHDPDALIVDVRSPGEFAGNRIRASRNIPLDELERRAVEIPSARKLVIVCQSGQRSARARDRLASRGFERVTSLAGGLNAWRVMGGPVEETKGAPWALERQVRVAAGSLVLLGVVLGSLVHPAFIGLSAFVGAGLVFAGITDWCGMGLLLARAPWNRRRDG